MTINIIGIDPGGHNGIAQLVARRDPAVYEMNPTDAVNWVTSYMRTWGIVGNPNVCHIACERFIVGRRTTKTTRQPDAMMVASAIEHASREYDNVEFTYQSASDAKMVTNAILRKMGLWTPKMDHGNDGMRHAVLRLLRLFPEAYQNLLTHGTMNP